MRGFFIFASLVHQSSFIIALDDSLEQCLITNTGKTCKKIWWLKFGLNGSKSGLELGFLSFFVFVPLVFLEIAQDDSLELCLTISRGKTLGKMSGDSNLFRNQFFCHFLKVASLNFLDIAQDRSLGQCLASSRAETSKKHFVAEIGAEMIFPILMSSSVHSNMLAYII